MVTPGQLQRTHLQEVKLLTKPASKLGKLPWKWVLLVQLVTQKELHKMSLQLLSSVKESLSEKRTTHENNSQNDIIVSKISQRKTHCKFANTIFHKSTELKMFGTHFKNIDLTHQFPQEYSTHKVSEN